MSETKPTADELMSAARLALRSYQYGNSAPQMAKDLADMIEDFQTKRAPTPACLSSNFGEGFHAALRKAVDSEEAAKCYQLINKMPMEEWGAIVDFVIDGLGFDWYVVHRLDLSNTISGATEAKPELVEQASLTVADG